MTWAARRFISWGASSSMWLAMFQRCPSGSSDIATPVAVEVFRRLHDLRSRLNRLLEDVIAVPHGHEQHGRPPSVLGLGSRPPGSSSPIMMIEPPISTSAWPIARSGIPIRVR